MADSPIRVEEPPDTGFENVSHSAETTSGLRLLVESNTGSKTGSGPRTALLTGPIGNDKHLLAEAVAGELNRPLAVIRPDSGQHVDLGSNLNRTMFDELNNYSPAVVVFEHLPAYVPEGGFSSSPERLQAITLFVDILENIAASNIVLGIANEVDDVHWRVRRPRIFNLYCPVGNPDRDRREAVLTSTIEAAHPEVSLRQEEFADLCERSAGLSADNLRNVVQRGIGLMHESGATILQFDHLTEALSRVERDLDSAGVNDHDLFDEEAADSFYRYQGHRSDDESDEEDDAMEFSWSLTDDGGGETISSAVQQDIKTPDVSYDDIGGLEYAKRALREAIEWPRKHPELCETMDIDTARGILLYGPPGNGKTMLAKAIANETESQFISVKAPEVMDKLVGQSQRFIAHLFEAADEFAPTVIFIDELDSITDERGQDTVSDEVVNQLLLELDGLEELSDVVLIGATNRPDIIDDALRRPGRLGTEIRVPQPDEDAKKEIFGVHIRDRPIAAEVTMDWLVTRSTDNMSGADVAGVCERAARNALRRTLENTEHDGLEELDRDDLLVQRQDFKQAFDDVLDDGEVNRTPGVR